jgi:queuine tRNA-ribosyltransferase
MRPELTRHATDGRARVHTVSTSRGSFETPVFMPVGTRGAVRHLAAADHDLLGAEVVLANTYHLMLRPGDERIAHLGGLRGFTGWDGHFLTDSGGYQVFSLSPDVDDEGVRFRSTYDGSVHGFTPEDAVRVQRNLGADIQMVLDVCPPLPSDRRVLRSAVDRTANWATRARSAFLAGEFEHQAQFGIVQGGTDADLRKESAGRTVACDFDGYAIGGLSVGEDRAALLETLDATTGHLPEGQLRYLMGVGDPVGLVEGIAMGVDMFDCVLPTRLARHGTALTWSGRRNLKNREFADDDRPIDPDFHHSATGMPSRAFIRHLLNTNEPTAARLLTLHNVAWLISLVADARKAIRSGELDELRARTRDAWG